MTRTAGASFTSDTSRSSAPINAAVEHLTDLVSAGKVTLLSGAHDTEHNNAVALAHHLAAR